MNTYADGALPFHTIDLDYVSRNLEQNPLPRDRYATQQHWWDNEDRWETLLRTAMKRAEANAQLLVQYHGGRLILDAECPGCYSSDAKYWFRRADYYRLEYDLGYGGLH